MQNHIKYVNYEYRIILVTSQSEVFHFSFPNTDLSVNVNFYKPIKELAYNCYPSLVFPVFLYKTIQIWIRQRI